MLKKYPYFLLVKPEPMREKARMKDRSATINAFALGAMVWFLASSAVAETTLHYDVLFGARGNPKGLALKTAGQLRTQLYASDSKLFAQNFAGPNLELTLSPANVKAGAGLALQPLSILQVYAQAVGIYYFGSFDRLQSFPTPNDDYSTQALLARSAQSLNYAAGGLQLIGGARFQIKAGPAALVAHARTIWQDFGLQSGDKFFYESELDILAADRGWVFHSDIDAVYFWRDDLILGVRHTFSQPRYSESWTRSIPNHRMGPLIGWNLRDGSSKTPSSESLMLLALVNWYLEHPYLAGRTSPQSRPYVAIAMQMKGAFWSATPSL